ncbi:MAG: hypothetical protein KAU58_05160, partial [Candidatus Omnitrophica bacterium]|nr:hypothetical protein [Candidatus Omnitrophota bacterium]
IAKDILVDAAKGAFDKALKDTPEAVVRNILMNELIRRYPDKREQIIKTIRHLPKISEMKKKIKEAKKKIKDAKKKKPDTADEQVDKKDKDELSVKPPPGWSPYGESTSGPQEQDKDAQLQSRQSADSDIRDKRDLIKEQERRKEEEERIKREQLEHGLYSPQHPPGGETYDIPPIPKAPPVTVKTKKHKKTISYGGKKKSCTDRCK